MKNIFFQTWCLHGSILTTSSTLYVSMHTAHVSEKSLISRSSRLRTEVLMMERARLA